MNVDAMRFIDRWAGIPLTFLTTIVTKATEMVLGTKRRQPDVSRTLFIELSEMGSAIIADPAMRKLQQQGEAELFFVIFKDNAKSLALLDTVPAENIYEIRSDSLVNMAVDVLGYIRWCRAKKITCTVDLELFSRVTALLGALSLTPSRVGFATLHDEGCYRGDLLTHPVRYNPHVHIGQNFVALVNTALGRHNTPYATSPIQPEELELAQADVSDEQKQVVMDKIKKLYPAYQGERIVLINPNASDLLPQRRWLPENFAKVMKDLLASYDDILLVITGAPAERDGAQALLKMVDHERCVNSAGDFKFEELVPLYSISTMMLTNDSGPAHFAAVTPLKVFVLFGPETPALYLPLGGNAEAFYLGLPCSPCVSAMNHRKTSCTERPCITGIHPEPVFERLDTYLKEIPIAQQ